METASKEHIFVVEDRDSLRRLLTRALSQEGYEVAAAATVREAVLHLEDRRFDLVLTDLKLPDGTGLDVLRSCGEEHPDMPVVVMTAFGTVQTAVEAMKAGAVDFLEKPVEIDDLFSLVRSLLDRGADPQNAPSLSSATFQPAGAPPIVGRHPKMAAALHLLRKVATAESTVLLTGESGTGKELFARALHALSPRSKGPFVAVNCAAIPETLMENELFGHEKGAFTGAVKRQPGRFELAGRGTIFLDEIGELKLEVQGKVLRVLEERVFERVGGGRSVSADARVVAATNRDLESMAANGTFRQDLFYRLDVFPIALPALRERRSDIPLLARFLVQELCGRLRMSPRELSRSAVDLLMTQPWPGNVRQLANLLERCLILSERDTLEAGEIEPHLSRGASPPVSSESDLFRRALREADGDKHRAAALLGISYRTLQRKVRTFDLEGYPKYRD